MILETKLSRSWRRGLLRETKESEDGGRMVMEKPQAVTDVDIFRDTALRYLGYANEFGEAFRTHIPRLMYLGSYGVASTYCLADSIDKGRQCYQESTHLSSYLQKRKAVETMVEAAIWQGLASVIIPGFTINRICAASRFTLNRCARGFPPSTQMWMTTIVGLTAIPFIIKPIDRLVDSVMDGLIHVSRQLGISHQLDHSHKK